MGRKGERYVPSYKDVYSFLGSLGGELWKKGAKSLREIEESFPTIEEIQTMAKESIAERYSYIAATVFTKMGIVVDFSGTSRETLKNALDIMAPPPEG